MHTSVACSVMQSLHNCWCLASYKQGKGLGCVTMMMHLRAKDDEADGV